MALMNAVSEIPTEKDPEANSIFSKSEQTARGSRVDVCGVDTGIHKSSDCRKFSLDSSKGMLSEGFAGWHHPQLDPFSPEFDLQRWYEARREVRNADRVQYPDKVLGASFTNLSVYGRRSSTDYQRTFGNYLLTLSSIFNRSIGRRRNTQVQILQQFDGLIRSGEMLLVLGRPGSGCSTLLKTLGGDTHGIFIGEGSQVNYQGGLHIQLPKLFPNMDLGSSCFRASLSYRVRSWWNSAYVQISLDLLR